MKTLVVGASGATGKELVGQLLLKGHEVKVIVRSPEKLPESWTNNEKLTIIKASVSELTVAEMAEHIKDCQAVASCLGHNLSWKGVYGKPRRLVTDAVRTICTAIRENHSGGEPLRFVLMNTSGFRNKALNERISFGQKIVIGLLRGLLPPHVDNEKAAGYLIYQVGLNDPAVEWAAVRPDNLINEEEVSPYEVHPSPIRSAIFNAGKTSRINVGHFMATLMTSDDAWEKWKGQTPVIYNKDTR